MPFLRLCCSFAFGLVIGVSSLLGGNAKAGMLIFKSEATVLAGSFVGSTVFSTNTVVKFTGQFDTAATIAGPTASATPFISLQIEIGNLGTFDAANPNDFFVFAFNPSVLSSPAIGIFGLSNGGYVGSFASTTQPFAYDALSPNEFLDWASTLTSTDPMVISLAGGNGDASFLLSDDDPVTVSISAVPEPTSMAIFGLGSLLFVARRVRRARSAV